MIPHANRPLHCLGLSAAMILLAADALISAPRAFAQVASVPVPATIDAALARAKATHEPVLVDFSALWCHSCWWMKANVMNGAEWDALGKHLVYLESDADSPDGNSWMKRLNVTGLPTYVMLGAGGKEIGRIVGEARREEFYPKLDRLIAGTDTLDVLKGQALQGSLVALAQVLDVYAARDDGKVALAWYASLPTAFRDRAGAEVAVTRALEAMHMHQDKREFAASKDDAAKARLARSCVAHGARVLAAHPEYDERIDILHTLSDCSRDFPLAQRKAILAAPVAEAVVQLDVQKLSRRPLPPGTREALLILGKIADSLGDKGGARAIYARGIAAYRMALDDGHGGLDLKRDRSADDDLYALYRISKQKEEGAALLKQLASVYSEDCNYALAYASLLLGEGNAAEALPYLERAAGTASGRYVLKVANKRASALLALKRRPEAEKVVAAALQAVGSWFPKDQESLKRVLSEDADGAAKKNAV